MTTVVEADDELRRRVLEQLCKGRSMAFAAGVTGATSSTVASIAEAAGWPDEDAARRVWLGLVHGVEAERRAPAPVVPAQRPPQEAGEPPAVPARFVAPAPRPEPAPPEPVAPDPAPVVPDPEPAVPDPVVVVTLPVVEPPTAADPLDAAPPPVRAIVLAHAAPPVLAAIRDGRLQASNVASLIRDVMPGHRPGTCLDCRRARA